MQYKLLLLRRSFNFLLQKNLPPNYFSPRMIIDPVETMAQAPVHLVLELDLHSLSKKFFFFPSRYVNAGVHFAPPKSLLGCCR